MMTVDWSASAVTDLSNIRAWLLAETTPVFTLSMLARIRRAADRLTAFPSRGSPVSDEERKIAVQGTSYRIVYQILPGRVNVLRVRHGRENWTERA